MKRKLFSALMALIVSLTPLQKANAFFGLPSIVFDPTNFGKNLLTAARTLQMVNQQAQAIQQRISMLQNMSKNLQGLTHTSLPNILQEIAQLNVMMQQAGQLAYEVNQARAIYRQTFPGIYQAQMSTDELVQLADRQWAASTDAYRHSVNVQSQISQNVITDQQTLSTLVNQSQNAVGAMQVAQAGNQLQALSIRQNTDLLQLLAVQGRAESLTQARAAESEKIALARLENFIGDGQLYTPLR